MMEMLILVINTGSSSIKYSLIDMSEEKTLSSGVVERIGIEGSKIIHNVGCQKYEKSINIKNHEQAVHLIIEMLTGEEYGVLQNIGSITALGHRIAHGGEELFESMVIDERVLQLMKNSTPLAPMHMPHMVKGIEIFKRVLSDKPMVAVFDTAFHQTMPEKAYLYAIPYKYYEKYGIRRYGFHGTSHKYVSRRAAELINRPLKSIKMITCHLGNGSSITAVDGGVSIDTSMGFTPVAGIPMGTRCGDIDAAITGYIAKNERISIQEVERIYNKESGFLGLSGISSDCRDIEKLLKEGNQRATITFEVFCYHIKKYIGAYVAVMNGINCIVFTGGIGENSFRVRSKVCSDMNYLGLQISNKKNFPSQKTQDRIISTNDSSVQVCVINTNEELMIARETTEVLALKTMAEAVC